MARKERLRTNLKRKLMRRRIATAEAISGGVILLVLFSAGVWVRAQKDNFDPGDRDISFELLEKDSVEDTLYRAPLKVWSEAGATTGGSARIDLGIFPEAVLDDGWAAEGRVEVYDPSNVYEKINGAAEQYIAFGFQRLHYLSIVKDSHRISLEIYDQGEFANTLGIFAAQRDARRRVATEGGSFFYTTPIGAVGGYAKYYFKMAGNTEAEAVRAKAAELLPLFAALPAQSGAVPAPYSVLAEGLSLDFDRISYERQNAFQYDFASDFWFGADAGESRFFVHQAANADEARALFDQLLEEQSYEYQVEDRGEGRAILRHEFLKTFFAMSVTDDMLFGVDGSADRATTNAGLARLEEATRG